MDQHDRCSSSLLDLFFLIYVVSMIDTYGNWTPTRTSIPFHNSNQPIKTQSRSTKRKNRFQYWVRNNLANSTLYPHKIDKTICHQITRPYLRGKKKGIHSSTMQTMTHKILTVIDSTNTKDVKIRKRSQKRTTSCSPTTYPQEETDRNEAN